MAPTEKELEALHAVQGLCGGAGGHDDAAEHRLDQMRDEAAAAAVERAALEGTPGDFQYYVDEDVDRNVDLGLK